MIELSFPWPDRALSPNARDKWAKIAAVKQARACACRMTIDAGYRSAPEGVELWLWFYPPTRKRYDLDNLIASMKPYIDGIFDALDVNDHEIIEIHAVREEQTTGGAVKLRIDVA